MNAILSIKQEFVKEIVSGRKRYEYRKAIFRQPVEPTEIFTQIAEDFKLLYVTNS